MNRLKTALACVLLASLIALVVYAILLVRTATAVVSALPEGISREIQNARAGLLAEVGTARADLTEQVEAARKDVLVRSERQVAAVRTDLMREVGEIRLAADRRVGDTLARADRALATVEALRQDVKPTLDHSAAITAHAEAASAVLFRRDALLAQLLGLTAAAKVTLGETAQTMRSVRGAVPGFLAQGQDIAANFQAITSNVNRLTKPRWYDRLLGYSLNGVVIYRNLNPETNLTVKGAQFVSSHP